jgi:hypothetical protein
MTAHDPHSRHRPDDRHGPHDRHRPDDRHRPEDRHHPDDRHRPDDRRRPEDRHRPEDPGQAALPADLVAVLAEIVPPGGAFRHREHIHLAYLAVQRHGAGAAAQVSGWIRQLAEYQRAPQKFNATVTKAWVEIVAHHAAAAPAGADFAAFATRYPELLDKRLLNRHYTSRALASPAARAGWLEPDLAAFPWTATPAP